MPRSLAQGAHAGRRTGSSARAAAAAAPRPGWRRADAPRQHQRADVRAVEPQRELAPDHAARPRRSRPAPAAAPGDDLDAAQARRRARCAGSRSAPGRRAAPSCRADRAGGTAASLPVRKRCQVALSTPAGGPPTVSGAPCTAAVPSASAGAGCTARRARARRRMAAGRRTRRLAGQPLAAPRDPTAARLGGRKPAQAARSASVSRRLAARHHARGLTQGGAPAGTAARRRASASTPSAA